MVHNGPAAQRIVFGAQLLQLLPAELCHTLALGWPYPSPGA